MQGNMGKKSSVVSVVSPFLIRELRIPDFVLDIDGAVPSKKNSYGVSGGRMFKTEKLRNFRTTVLFQIPNELRELKLENPSVMVQFFSPKKSWRGDRDNRWTTILDELVNVGFLKDDSTNHFNGVVIQLPVIESDKYRCEIKVWRNEIDA